MKTFYAGTFIDKAILKEEGILYPIKLEYYKIEEQEKYLDKYGIEIIKTEYLEKDINVEKNYINNITNNEKHVNRILEVLKDNQVTPISLGDIIEDLLKK